MKLFLLLNRLTLTLLTPVFYSYILSILYIRPSHASSMFYTECASIHVCHISDSFQSFYPSNPCWSEDVGNILRILHGSELSIGRIEVWIEVKKNLTPSSRRPCENVFLSTSICIISVSLLSPTPHVLQFSYSRLLGFYFLHQLCDITWQSLSSPNL